ncbi:675_t:CDS:2 [Funneliformis mosseae]|uniref:675_t:CDS:1 n=1 Tax=Funneliformis mosseae TaxID=27381 RepID=A0A9N9BU93_FUNMO|nr:675_t:CDS:2 [Funneliformis mosseae]
MSEFYKNLSNDFIALLDNSDDYNVVIRVGEEEKAFRAHSVILRARSPYFKTALSSDWARKEGGSIMFTKPNVTPTVFEIILKYIYSGDIDLNSKDTSDILELLIASDELLLQELFNHVQSYLLTNKKEWIKKNVVKVHRTINSHEGCQKLQNFCLETICKNPLLVFKSDDFSTFEESLLLPLLSRDDLQSEEIEVWDHLIQWGISQMDQSSSCPPSKDVSKWEKKDFKELQRILKNCIPLIRFFEISSSEFYDKVYPYQSILPKDLKEDLMKYYLKSGVVKPQNWLSKPRVISFDSTLIKQEHVARLCDWIDRKDGKPYTFENVPYKFRLLIRGTKDGFESETFHEKCDHKGPTIVVMQIAYSGELVGGYNPIEWSTGDSRITTQNSFLFSFPKQGNIADAKLSRVNRPGYAIRVKDKTHGPCFGDKDLWMKHNFNAYDSCSSDKDDYQDRVTTLSKFWVIEYEVFQVIKK